MVKYDVYDINSVPFPLQQIEDPFVTGASPRCVKVCLAFYDIRNAVQLKLYCDSLIYTLSNTSNALATSLLYSCSFAMPFPCSQRQAEVPPHPDALGAPHMQALEDCFMLTVFEEEHMDLVKV